MSDEQTPEVPPLQEEVQPLPIERKPPRVATGWVVSGVMLFLWISNAVYGYMQGFSGEPSFGALQEAFEKQVSVAHSLPEKLKETGDKGIRDVLKDALKDAGEHEEAARIAVVAAHELGEEPDEKALETLTFGEDLVSHDMAAMYTYKTVNESFLESFTAEESSEFAVRLAQTHALEMSGEDGGRDAFLDKALLLKTTAVMLAVGIGGVGGAFCLILFFAARSAGRLKPVGFAGMTVWDGDRLMIRFAFYLVGFTVIGIGGATLNEENLLSSIWASAATLLATSLLVVAMLYFSIMGKADGFKEIVGGKAQDFWKNVKIGLFGYLCTIPIIITVLAVVFYLGDLIPQPTHPMGEEMLSATPFDWIAIALTAAILAPFIEELTFRGLLFPALGTQFKRPLWAVLVCGFLFAAIHPQGPMIWPALMMIGSVTAYVRYYTGSLVPSFVIHFVHNSVIVVTSLLMI